MLKQILRKILSPFKPMPTRTGDTAYELIDMTTEYWYECEAKLKAGQPT